MDRQTYEEGHETSLRRLVGEFGTDKTDEIKQLYDAERTFLEQDATIHDFVPVLAYRGARDIMRARYQPKSLERKMKKYEQK